MQFVFSLFNHFFQPPADVWTLGHRRLVTGANGRCHDRLEWCTRTGRAQVFVTWPPTDYIATTCMINYIATTCIHHIWYITIYDRYVNMCVYIYTRSISIYINIHRPVSIYRYFNICIHTYIYIYQYLFTIEIYMYMYTHPYVSYRARAYHCIYIIGIIFGRTCCKGNAWKNTWKD